MDLCGLPYTIVPMEAEHVPTVAAIEERVFPRPWSYASFMREVRDNPHSDFIVLSYRPWAEDRDDVHLGGGWRGLFRMRDEDRSILGYGGFWVMLDEAHICTLAVRDEWRGCGLGELLFLSLVERSLNRACLFLTLEVRESNIVAQRLYRKYGFVQTGRRRGYYLDNHEDALIMTVEGLNSPAYREQITQFGERLRERLLREARAHSGGTRSMS